MNWNVINMFSAKKVKLHGMKSEKWTTKDKINQYKGLISLYTRDRKIIELDTNVTRRKLSRLIKDLQKAVYNDRRELDNEIRGDKQKLRNTLAEHRELQLAFQNSQPKKVIEEIKQRNFNKRKVLDRLKYEKKMRSQKLIDLKLEQALLEDRLKYAFLGQIKQEKEAQIITGKLQDAILRKEGASAIYHIYREIIDIMKKDALYFDAIIATVRNDGFSQSKCFLGATKLGQLATEYLDDRRQEYDTLEKIIIKDMTTRKTDIRVLQEHVEHATASIKMLLRKDSDITTCARSLKDSPSMENLRRDVDQVEKTLAFLKNTTLARSYDAIYPCLEEQLKQKRRLKRLTRKCERDRDIMLNKTNHANLMNSVLKTSMNETTVEYKARKKELKEEMETLRDEKRRYEKLLQSKRTIAANIRIALRQLLQLSYDISDDTRKKSAPSSHPFGLLVEKKEKPEETVEDEIDGSKIIPILVSKFTPLMSHYFALKHETKPDEAFRNIESMMQERMIPAEQSEEPLSEASLLEGIYVEASEQLTREDIKKQSQEIVAANTKNEDLVPLIVVPFNKWKKMQKQKK
ncbi:hyaluronan-mediated motility receptor-like [Tribolium madens]|uniref:hyaluronan-mediated motility receptor-like n=1 Tax=Tribolium madens TaxID=41895 RepID=UPI001CF75E19|nr:hyaluronan-mediated motility receptor-like [Tribolium madens]